MAARLVPLSPEAPVVEPAKPASVKLDLKNAPSGSASGLACRVSRPSSTATMSTGSVSGSCTSRPSSAELAAPSEDGSKSSDNTSCNDSIEATRLPGYMEGFASGYARGRAAAMLEHFSSHRASAMPDEMEPVDEVSFYASGERKRCRSACVNCRETRTRCVMLRCGSCSGCVEQGISCVQSVSKKRGPKEARAADKRNRNHRMLLLAQEVWQRSSEADASRRDEDADAAAPGAPAAVPLAAATSTPLAAAMPVFAAVQGVMPPAPRHSGRPGQPPPEAAALQMHLSHMIAMPSMYDGRGALPASMSFAHAQQLRHGFTSDYQAYQNQILQLQAYVQHQRHAAAVHGRAASPWGF